MNRRMDVLMWSGFAGGAAEVVVISVLALVAGIGGWGVAVGVSEATFGSLFSGADAIVVGMVVHFALSFLIVACLLPFAARIQARTGTLGVLAVSAAALCGVWAMNFFVVLPRVAPEFVTIVPLWASFLSKLSFGLATGAVLVSPYGLNGSRRRTPA